MSSSTMKCNCGSDMTLKYITHVELLKFTNQEIRIKFAPYYICNKYPHDVTHFYRTERTKIQIKYLIGYALKNNLKEITYIEML